MPTWCHLCCLLVSPDCAALAMLPPVLACAALRRSVPGPTIIWDQEATGDSVCNRQYEQHWLPRILEVRCKLEVPLPNISYSLDHLGSGANTGTVYTIELETNLRQGSSFTITEVLRVLLRDCENFVDLRFQISFTPSRVIVAFVIFTHSCSDNIQHSTLQLISS